MAQRPKRLQHQPELLVQTEYFNLSDKDTRIATAQEVELSDSSTSVGVRR
jgi:hypothetical protein